jgi:hypothetical protein
MMKTLTTLTAVAALIAGISIASAQNAGGSSSSPSSINKGMNTGTPNAGQSGSESSTTAMKSGGTMEKQAMGNGKFCIETTPGGSVQCKYASLATCEKDAKPQGLRCSPKSATTGSK